MCRWDPNNVETCPRLIGFAQHHHLIVTGCNLSTHSHERVVIWPWPLNFLSPMNSEIIISPLIIDTFAEILASHSMLSNIALTLAHANLKRSLFERDISASTTLFEQESYASRWCEGSTFPNVVCKGLSQTNLTVKSMMRLSSHTNERHNSLPFHALVALYYHKHVIGLLTYSSSLAHLI